MSEYVRDAHQFKINRTASIDSAVLTMERSRIFDKCWLYVGHESELKKPNSFKTRNLAGLPVIFTRDHTGQDPGLAELLPAPRRDAVP